MDHIDNRAKMDYAAHWVRIAIRNCEVANDKSSYEKIIGYLDEALFYLKPAEIMSTENTVDTKKNL